MLTLPIATESFESISRRDGKLANVADPIQEIDYNVVPAWCNPRNSISFRLRGDGLSTFRTQIWSRSGFGIGMV
jgi:hypothetical protein